MTLPRDTYDGPVLAGQRWRQRGLSGHGQYLVTVLRMASRSVQLVVEGGGSGAGSSQAARAGRSGRIHVGKRYNVPLDIFRSNYVLVSQPKGYKAPTPLDVALGQVPRHPAQKLASTRLEDLYSHSALRNDPTPTECLDEQIDAFASILDHPATPETPAETPEEAATDVAEPETETPQPDPPPEGWTYAPHVYGLPARPGGPEVVEGPPPAAPGTPPQEAPEAPQDPAVGVLEATSRYLTALGAGLDRMRREREEFWLEVQALDKRIAVAEARYETTAAPARALERAIRAAITAETSVPVLPPDRSVAQENGAEITPVIPQPPVSAAPPEGVEQEDPLGPRPVGQGRLSQRAWVEGYLRGEKLQGKHEVLVADIAQGFAGEFGFPLQRAKMNVSSLMVENNKRTPRLPSWPAMQRVEKGRYRFV